MDAIPQGDQPPLVPGSPEPLREHGSQSLTGLAMAARAALQRSLARVRSRFPNPCTDVTGRGFIVLSTGSVPISQLVETLDGRAPFSITVFTDDDGNERWLPAPSSLLAYDGDYWFTPFQPTLAGTPIGNLDFDTAPALAAGGATVWLRISWTVDDKELVPDQDVYAVRVNSVEVVVLAYNADKPADDLNSRVLYRPWFRIGPPDGNGVRTLIYKTLGYAHFWLFVKSVPTDGPGDEVEEGPASAHQACFAINSGGKRLYPTWGMILRPLPMLRVTVDVSLKARTKRRTKALPAELVQSVEPGTLRVINVYPPQMRAVLGKFAHKRSEDGTLTIESPDAFASMRKVSVTIEGRMVGTSEDPVYTDDAGRAHNHKFWRTIP